MWTWLKQHYVMLDHTALFTKKTENTYFFAKITEDTPTKVF
jgi:hypothetical protein